MLGWLECNTVLGFGLNHWRDVTVFSVCHSVQLPGSTKRQQRLLSWVWWRTIPWLTCPCLWMMGCWWRWFVGSISKRVLWLKRGKLVFAGKEQFFFLHRKFLDVSRQTCLLWNSLLACSRRRRWCKAVLSSEPWSCSTTWRVATSDCSDCTALLLKVAVACCSML